MKQADTTARAQQAAPPAATRKAQRRRPPAPIRRTLAASVGFGVLCALAWPTSTPSTATEAAPGAPLYEIAVIEALEGLRRSGQARPQPQPCPQCGQIHESPQAAHAQAAPPPPAGAVRPSSPPAASDPARVPRYRYCANCLMYHPVARTDPGH